MKGEGVKRKVKRERSEKEVKSEKARNGAGGRSERKMVMR